MLSLRSLTAIALSFALVLIGINSQSGWLFWLAGLALAALVVSWADSLMEVRRLAVARFLASEAVEGEAVEITLQVRNRGRFSRNLLLVVDEDPSNKGAPEPLRVRQPRRRLRDLLASAPANPHEQDALAGGRALLLLPRVEAGGEVSISYLRGGLRRGVYLDWPVHIYSEGILGLARHHAKLAASSRLTVLPYHAELSRLPLLDSLHRMAWSPAGRSARGGGMDFYGVREFQPGDPLRHIHWKTTARRGDLVVREFEEGACMPLLILIDNREIAGASVREGTLLDIQARLAASVVHYARLCGHPVTLAAYEGRELLHHEVQATHAALHWLASLEPSGKPTPEEQIEGLRFLLAGNSLLCHLVIADGAAWAHAASTLPASCRLALVLVIPTPAGGDGGSIDESGERESLVRDLLVDAPPGMVGCAVYREGDDLAECLERSFLA